MDQNKISTKGIWFVVGIGLMVFGSLSSCGGSQPSYSAQQDSYNSHPQQYSSGGTSAELVGHWQYTDIVDSSIPLMTDYNIYFYADGTFEMDEVNESGEHSNYASGTWSATGSNITLNTSDGQTVQIGYSFNNNVLIFENTQGYYERVEP
jgi:hypothetical protein